MSSLRRDFLGFTAGAVAARTVLPAVAKADPVHPDAELIQLAQEIIRGEEASQATNDAIEHLPLDHPASIRGWAELLAGVDVFHAQVQQLAALRATTITGAAWKARVLWPFVDVMRDGGPPDCCNPEAVLGWSICRDLLALDARQVVT